MHAGAAAESGEEGGRDGDDEDDEEGGEDDEVLGVVKNNSNSTGHSSAEQGTGASMFVPPGCIDEEDISGGEPDELLKLVGFIVFVSEGGGLCALIHGVRCRTYYHLPVMCYVSYAEV